MKISLIALFLFAFSILAFAQTNNPPQNREEFSGNYMSSDGLVGSIYKLTEDGHYSFETFSDYVGTKILTEEGSYSLTDGLLHLKINKRNLDKYNLLDPKEATEAYKIIYNYDPKAEDIKTEYDLLFVKWGNRFYLFRPEDVYKFIAAVNFGIEPRKSTTFDNYLLIGIYLRGVGDEKNIEGKPIVFGENYSYLLNTPITAKIKKIEIQDKMPIFIVNKGRAEGLKKGMWFVEENTKPEDSNLLFVDSVQDHSAKLKNVYNFAIPKYQIGNVLTTKTIRE